MMPPLLMLRQRALRHDAAIDFDFRYASAIFDASRLPLAVSLRYAADAVSMLLRRRCCYVFSRFRCC